MCVLGYYLFRSGGKSKGNYATIHSEKTKERGSVYICTVHREKSSIGTPELRILYIPL